MQETDFTFNTSYQMKIPDLNGIIHYTADENAVWQELLANQLKITEKYACQEFIDGLNYLDFPEDQVPQCSHLSQKLKQKTGWEVVPVPALINNDYFFSLLAKRQFPAATFIRRRDEFDYVKEPDIFHEFFGHCPLLTEPSFADFTAHFGEVAVQADSTTREYLARLYWFTIEFGLIRTAQGLRCYGGGILSSPAETVYALKSPYPSKKPFDLLTVLRTPYRIDMKQPVYFFINDFAQLFESTTSDLSNIIAKAKKLGDLTLEENGQ